MESVWAEVAALKTRMDAAEAVLAIQELKSRYGELVDSRFARGRLRTGPELHALAALIAETFTPNGVWDGGPALGKAVGRAQIAERMSSSPLTFSRHFFVKPQIKVDGARATGRWDILAPCTFDTDKSSWMCGFEEDVYERSADGGWLHERMKLTTIFLAPGPSDGWGKIFA
jgi:SnoaL-like domain